MRLLRDILSPKKKPLFSTEEMASVLFGLTVGTDDSAGLDRLKAEIDDIACHRMSRDVARAELVFLKLSAVFCALTAQDVRALHGTKADLLAQHFLAHFKERMEQRGPDVEEEFLQLSETRLATCNRAFQVWRDDPEHRNCFAIGQAFFDFCGVHETNPVTLFRVHLNFTTIVRLAHDAIGIRPASNSSTSTKVYRANPLRHPKYPALLRHTSLGGQALNELPGAILRQQVRMQVNSPARS